MRECWRAEAEAKPPDAALRVRQMRAAPEAFRVIRARKSGYSTQPLRDHATRMRRHFLFPEEEDENGVGDGNANLLQLWLDRRAQILRHESVARFLTLFWDLAKPKHDARLSAPQYSEFFARVAKALLQSVNNDGATAIGHRDWLYDVEGAAGGQGAMTFELFREALMQIAEFILPVESEQSMYVSFFLELRECIAMADGLLLATVDGGDKGPACDDDEGREHKSVDLTLKASLSSPQLYGAVCYALRPLKDVTKIRGAFLQKMPPGNDQLKAISGLAPPNSQQMSLKQLLLCYNPRKFALSRKFSALFAAANGGQASSSNNNNNNNNDNLEERDDEEQAIDTGNNSVSSAACRAALAAASAPASSNILNKESEDDWDDEIAAIKALEQFPAFRVAVVGPPHCGKTRVAKLLADKLQLRYFSIGAALEEAVSRKQLRRQASGSALVAQTAATTAAANDEGIDGSASALETESDVSEPIEGEAPPEAVGDEASPAAPLTQEEPTSSPASTERSEPVHDEDVVFSDADFDALLAGETLARSKCLDVFVFYVKKSLLEGVGVVMDDIHPDEIAAAIGTDYLVALSAARDDLEQQVQQFAIAPSTRRVYSARERAILAADTASIEALGFADFVREPEHLPSAPSDPKVVDDKAEDGTEDSETGEADGEAEAEAGSGDAAAADGDGEPGSPQPLAEPTQAERNQIEPPREPTLSIRSLLMESFRDRYRDYVSRVEERLTALVSCSALINGPKQRYHIIHVLASQSLCVIVDHCVRAITGSSMGISRTSVSRRAIPVTLPEEIAALSSSPTGRADQIRWLLHGNWRELNRQDAAEKDNDDDEGGSEGISTAAAAATDTRWSRLPFGKRKLSRWREFCPVSSSAESGLSLGDPALAVCFSRRVYLPATPEARAAFCAHPLQYLRKTPQAKPVSRIWLVSSSALPLAGDGHESSPSSIAAALGLPAFDAVEILAKRTPMSVQMELMEGKTLSGAHAAGIVADAILHQQSSTSGTATAAWILSNLSFTSETVAALKERECLPEMVVVLDPSQERLEREAKQSNAGGGIVMLKHQQFQTALVATRELLTEAGVAIKTSALHDDVEDTLAALRRQLDPLAPHCDRVGDGHVTPEDIGSAFAPSPASEDEDGGDSTGETSAPETARPEKGETSRFCPVSWLEKRVVVPGLPEFVTAFNFRFYAFAGKREQDAFERNPVKYLPKSYNATSSLTPTVVLLGVRGTGIQQLSKGVEALINSNAESKGYSAADVDLAYTNERLAKRLRSESLKGEDAQRSPLDLYIDELKVELQSCVEKCQAMAGSSRKDPQRSSGCVVLGGLGADDSRLPSPELLQICFQQNVFPVLVIPLTMADEQTVQSQLKQWRASLPERRKKLKVRRRTSSVEGGGGEPEPDDDDDEPEFNLEEAEAEETQRLMEQLLADQEALAAAVDAFRARGIAIAQTAPIDVSGSFRQSVSRIAAELDALMKRKDALFDTCEVVAERDAVTRLLAAGELTVGKHGAVCPVSEGRIPSHLLSSPSSSAVQYRGRLYFPHDSEALAAFASNPSRYIRQTVSSAAPPCKPTCCVAGAPFVGKTRFARDLASKYRLVYVSPRAAIDWVVQCHGATALSKRLQAAQNAGANPDVAAVDEAIVARLQSSECQLNGWVLDDFLQTPDDLQRFKANTAIDPGLLFILDGSFQTVWNRKKKHMPQSDAIPGGGGADAAEAEQIQRVELNAARDLLVQEFSVWERQRLDLIAFWNTQYGSFHLRQISATQTSLWNALAQAHERIDAHIAKTRSYRKELVAGRPAPLDGVVRRVAVLQSQSHPVFQRFCPVELNSSRYCCSSWASDRQLCVEFENQCFWLANAHNLEQFAARPADFLSPEQQEEAASLIQKAPLDPSLLSLISVADCEFPDLKGYCPVTFKLGKGAKDWSAIVRGHVFYRSSYLHKVYFFASEEMRRRFLAEPALFASQKLPVKLPPQLSTTLAKNFPGKLEQELSAVLNESLLVLGSERPKFLQTGAGASACFYLALILKTRAKALPEHAKSSFRAKRDAFELDCRLSEMLKAAITPSNASCGTAVKGVRAVRGSAGSSLSGAASSAGQEDMDVQELCRRFDKITGSSGTNPRIDGAAVKAAFLEYATL